MIDLPEFSPLRITQSPDKAGRKQFDTFDHVIAVFPEKPAKTAFRALPKPAQMQRLFGRLDKSGNASITSHLENKRSTALSLTGFSAENCFEALTWARKVIAEAVRLKAAKIAVLLNNLDDGTREAAATALLRAADAAAFELATFKGTGSKKSARLRSLKFLAANPRLPIGQMRRGNMGNNIARWLTALPPNKLTASRYRAAAQELARQHSMKYEFLNGTRLRRLDAGAFLAVAQGNADDDAGIVHLSYRPEGASEPSLALVGKGILFDTGGTNLKPFRGMLDMHTDMQGSAVALGTAVELASRKVPFAFDVWLAITENRISATAYKSQDVVVAANGVSIQVIHTDAEGRMVLADTLALAARDKPKLMIDFATLTGTCVSALTTRYSGIFSNRAASAGSLLEAGKTSGERVWPFPLDDDFEESLKSDVADIKQCAVDGNGDHIYAARFLKRFVPEDVAWVHIDLSAGQHKGGLGAIPTEITGFGVHYTLELLGDTDPSELAASWA